LTKRAIEFASEPRSMTELRDHLAPHADTEADAFWWLVKIYAPFVHAPGKTAWSYGRRPLLVGAPAWLKERAFADEQANAHPVPETPYSNELNNAIDSEMQAVWGGSETVEAATQRIAQKLDAVLANTPAR